MTKLNRHYLFLLIAYSLLGPLLPALFLMLLGGASDTLDWEELSGFLIISYGFGLLPALITGALVRALGLRRNRQGLNFTLAIALILAVVLALYLSQNWGDFSAVLLTSALAAGLLYRALPQPTVDYWPVTKLQRHYCFLFLGFTVLGPLLPGLFLMLLGGASDLLLDWEERSAFLLASYLLGLLPALLTGALVWRLNLRRDLKGIATTLGLGFLMAALYGLIMMGIGNLGNAVLGLCGLFATLFFCPFLPAPDKQP